MKLYAIHDDPSRKTHHEERWWCAVWAKNYSEALDIAAANYSGDGPKPYRNLLDGDEVKQDDQRLAEYTPENPCMEHRLRVLRLIGWREESDDICDDCGLASLGLEGCKVCCQCSRCVECGCECEATFEAIDGGEETK